MQSKAYSPEIYRLEEYDKVTEDKTPYVFIYSDPETDSVFGPRKINGKEIVVVNTDDDVFAYVEKVALVLEIEPIIIVDDELALRINHDLLMQLDYPLGMGNFREKLSPIERNILAQSVVRAQTKVINWW